MSQSNMNGFVTDEQDAKHTEVFSESLSASNWMKHTLPNDGDSMFFGYNTATEEWVILKNKGGRLWIEVGEAAA